MKLKRACCLLLAVLLLLPSAATLSAQAAPLPDSFASAEDSAESGYTAETGYAAFLAEFQEKAHPDESAAGVLSGELSKYNNASGLMMREDKEIAITAEVPSEGLYALKISYIAVAGNNIDISFALTINGKSFFNLMNDLSLSKLFADSGEPITDRRGNQLRPDQNEVIREQTVFLSDPNGYHSGALLFYFTSGTHELRLISTRGEALITALSVTQPENIPTNAEYLAELPQKETSGQYIKIDAEKPAVKSSPMLYAACDKTSRSIDPYPAGREKLNIIGGSNFSTSGQWVEYVFQVEETGFYYINIKYKQNISIGNSSYRDIFIDDKIVSQSFQSVEFSYDSRWQNRIPEDEKGEPAKLYLTAGEHTLRICVTLGEYSAVLPEIEEAVAVLNNAYLESILFLTTSPDVGRDYNVEKNLSNVLKMFREEAKQLKRLSSLITKVAGGANGAVALIDRFAFQLRNILKDAETYPRRLSDVKSNITALAALITSMSAQPLMMDYIELYSADVKIGKAEAGIFANLYNEAVNFIYTFSEDYNSTVSESGEKGEVTVWIPTGRDQYKTLNSLVINSFTPKTGITANLKLVSPGNLLPATVAGLGPDVIVQVSNGDPLNYAIRGAACGLSEFSGYEDVLTRFSGAALVPLSFDGEIYGLPETENFYMMFYRTDILEKLNLDVPQTWKDFLAIVTLLQQNNLSAGLPNTIETFAMLLLQQGGRLYADDAYRCVINNAEGVRAFTEYTNFFNNYGLPLQYDALTRFRMGEMPIVIGDFSFFNTLQIGAPEIRRLWDFTAVPGSLQDDGSVDHSVVVTGTAAMLMQGANNKTAAWEFLNWWTSEEAQTGFGRGMEMMLGTSGRVPTANLKAFEALAWSKSNSEAIAKAREFTHGLENVPGSYFFGRHVQNAFRRVVISNGDAKDSLRYYTKIINNEIAGKCAELGISLER